MLSASLGLLVVVPLSLAEFVAYFTDRRYGLVLEPFARQLAHSNITEVCCGVSVGDVHGTGLFTAFFRPTNDLDFLLLTSLTMLLGSIALGLLLHLLCFHAYLKYHGLSTYAYVVLQRQCDQLRQQGETAMGTESSKRRLTSRNSVAPLTATNATMHNDERQLASNGNCLRSVREDHEALDEAATPPPKVALVSPHRTDMPSNAVTKSVKDIPDDCQISENGPMASTTISDKKHRQKRRRRRRRCAGRAFA